LDTPSRSRGMNCPSFAPSFALLENRGHREDRVRAAPAVSCAIAHKNAHTSIQVQRRASGLPCAMVLRRTSRSPWCANSFSHHRPRIDGWSRTRSGRRILRGLDTSNGCQDHATWPYASAPFACVPSLRSRTLRGPPCDDICAPTLPRPPHPAPRLVTIAKRPSVGDGIPEVVRVIWGKREADYFLGRSFFDLRRRANQW